MNVHQLGVDAAFDSLRTATTGLTSAEAARRLDEFGANTVERLARVSVAAQFLREFTHFFALVLWVAAALAFVADLSEPGHGMRALAFAIVAVIAVNGVFSFWQEYRAEKAFLALQQLLPRDVVALRDRCRGPHTGRVSVSGRYGVLVVRSSKVCTVIWRRPGDVGLYFRIGISVSFYFVHYA